MKNTLIQIFHKLNAVKQGNFTLASGKKSDFYVDARVVNLTAEGICCVNKYLNDLNCGNYDTIGGMTIGADPIVCGLLTYAFVLPPHKKLNSFLWRKEQKEHGLKRSYEGTILPNAKILLVDDVATSGSSLLEVYKQLMQLDLNVTVVAAFVVVDRQEGAKEALAAQGIPLFAMLTKQELLESLVTV
jgi:orotate phosphoribosyltransferase